MTEKSTGPDLLVDLAQPRDADAADDCSVEVSDACADRLLVDRCLAGDGDAWEELYNKWHAPLCAAIKSLINSGYCDPNLIDEIAGRVWYALLRNDGELFDQFDPSRDLRLGAFFRGLARVEVMRYFRAERRRRVREDKAGRIRPRHNSLLSDWQIDVILREFTATLTPRERQFLKEYLLSPPEEDTTANCAGFSYANILQQRHRIRIKLKAFFGS
jgi:hypothetical protein